MAKVVNKKFVAILMVIFFSFCLIATSVSAAEAEAVTNVEDILANGTSVTALGDEAQPTSINSLLLNTVAVYAYGTYDGSTGNYSIDGEYGYSYGPSTILNCTVSNNFYEGMGYFGFDYYHIYLNFTVSGTNLIRYVIYANDEVVKTVYSSSSGSRTEDFIVPRSKNVKYSVVVYSNNTSAVAWGQLNVA